MTLRKTLMTAAIFAALPLAACSKAPEVPSAKAAADKAQSMADRVPAMDVKANAVLIYADWCSSCKVLDPKVQAAKPMFDGKGLNFITLDFTDKNRSGFMAQAEEAGVGPAISKAIGEQVKTGQLILVSADGKRVISKVGMNHTPAEIAAKFKEAVAKG